MTFFTTDSCELSVIFVYYEEMRQLRGKGGKEAGCILHVTATRLLILSIVE